MSPSTHEPAWAQELTFGEPASREPASGKLVFGELASQELASGEALTFSRAEHLLRQQEFERALEEFGRLPKERYEDPALKRSITQGLVALYRAKRPSLQARPRKALQTKAVQQLRVTRRRQDADQNSDQSFDSHGWQINEHWEAELESRVGLRGRFLVDLDGFRDGHNDLRYRTLLADLSKGSTHLALGDSATYPSRYFLRGSRMRGIQFFSAGETNEFQAVLGGYPVWLESRDQYVYPRTVLGVRDRIRLAEDRFRLGANLVQTRDSEKIRTDDGANPQARVDVANQPRDNVVFSLDQEARLIPGFWSVKAAQAYSVTDDNLLQDRFGDTAKLKDSAFYVESLLRHPFVRWEGSFERIGPDFRLLTDLPQGAVNSPKDIQADTQRLTHLLDPAPIGPLDLFLEASWVWNNLDNDDTIGHTRQRWYTATLDLETPPDWPRPEIRQTLYETISSPGSTTRPSQTRTSQTQLELSHRWGTIAGTLFADYEVEHPLKEESTFDEEERWGIGTRWGAPIGRRLSLSSRYRYEAFDDLVDEVRGDGIRHEANLSGSLRLWSTASLSLGYTYLTGKLINPGGTRLEHSEGHVGSVGFHWPYLGLSWDRRRRFSASPGLILQASDYADDLEERLLATGNLRLAYESYPDWKVELSGDFRFDEDDDRPELGTEESRLSLLWTHRL